MMYLQKAIRMPSSGGLLVVATNRKLSVDVERYDVLLLHTLQNT
jgi:hypothetical protein